jgi:hypothetical protein
LLIETSDTAGKDIIGTLNDPEENDTEDNEEDEDN